MLVVQSVLYKVLQSLRCAHTPMGVKSRWKLKLKEKVGSKAPKFVVSAETIRWPRRSQEKWVSRMPFKKGVSSVSRKTERNACLQAATPDTHIAGHHLRFQCPRSQNRCFAFGKRESHHCACLDLCWPNAPQSVLRSRKPGGDVTGEAGNHIPKNFIRCTLHLIYINIYIYWHMTYTLYRMKICSEPSMITNVWNTTMLHLLLNAPWGCRFNFDCPSWLLESIWKELW